jgi:enoyl-CoA hydratase
MSKDSGIVRLEQRGAVGLITFDRPDARNAMTWEMYQDLDAALDRIAREAALRVVVLRGMGSHFVAGTDIAQFANFKSAEDGVSYEVELERVVSKLESLRLATIAAVDGFAVGAGLVLAAACDVRVATSRARFGVPIAKTVGNCLSMANYARLVALLGASRTKAMLITADFMTAEDARSLGFVSQVVAPEVFDNELEALCDRVASHAPLTIQATKEAVRRIVSGSVEDGDDLIRRAYGSQDFHEGVAAFLEKRAARWQGR